jgi:metal-sulfur cluster biosynthetic enzyme
LETELTKKVSARLSELVDEETGRKFGELNIVTEVSDAGNGSVLVRFQPLAAYSPLAVDIGREIRSSAMGVEGVVGVKVECDGHMMNELVNKLVNKEEPKK